MTFRPRQEGVYLYRGETRDVAMELGLDCSGYQGPMIPVIYQIDFREPDMYFLATDRKSETRT